MSLLKALDPYRWLAAGVVVASMVSGFFWYRHTLIQDGREQVQAEVQKAVQKQRDFAEAQSRNLQEIKDEELQLAHKRAAENAAAAALARTELERLRKQSTGANTAAGTSQAACVEYAAAATDVLNECASALVSLGEAADGHVNDIRTLTGSWPEWDKFSNEMTSFQTRLQAFINPKGQ